MKNLKRIAVLALAGALAVTSLVGCGKKQQGGNDQQRGSNSTTDIEIAYWHSGLGEEWLKAVIEAFKEENPEYNVYYSASASAASINSTLELEENTVDLYLGSERTDVSNLEPLDDILSETAPGDNKKLSEKFNADYLENAKTADGHYYQLTYGGGVVGVVYNKELFKEAGITELPRTTNELAIACDKLYSKGITPICHFSTADYYDFFSEALISQYEGTDYAEKFYGCVDANGVSPSKAVFTTKDGRFEVLKAYEKIITPEYVMEGSNSVDHVTAQTQFLNEMAAMMINGSWVGNEMASVDAGLENYSMMRMPVLSAITDKLTTVKSDAQLRKVISAIDSVQDGEKQLSDYADGENYNVDGLEVSATDWDSVYTARYTVASNYSGENAYIPKSSNNIEGAKKFLAFLYSDAGYKIYAETLKIALPLSLSDGSQLDTSTWNAFQKSQIGMLEEAIALPTRYVAARHDIFKAGGATKYADVTYIAKLCASNKADRRTADEIWDEVIAKINDNYENKWLANIK